MSMNDLKIDATRAAAEVEIQWDMLDNPIYRRDFESILEKASKFVPELEGMYTNLTNGKSVAYPNEDTSLDYSDIERYTGLITDELFSAYILQEVYHKYSMVQNVLQSAIDNTE